jgi:hypothetical protein
MLVTEHPAKSNKKYRKKNNPFRQIKAVKKQVIRERERERESKFNPFF